MASRGSESDAGVFDRRLLLRDASGLRDERRGERRGERLGERNRSRLLCVLLRGDLDRGRDDDVE